MLCVSVSVCEESCHRTKHGLSQKVVIKHRLDIYLVWFWVLFKLCRYFGISFCVFKSGKFVYTLPEVAKHGSMNVAAG